MIIRAVQNEYDGKWGVVIVQNLSLISKIVHWAIPDIKDSNGVGGIGEKLNDKLVLDSIVL